MQFEKNEIIAMYRRLLLFLILIANLSYAQELTVKGLQATNDLSASEHRRVDINKENCGLVKVSLAVSGAEFEGNVIPPVEYKSGEY